MHKTYRLMNAAGEADAGGGAAVIDRGDALPEPTPVVEPAAEATPPEPVAPAVEPTPTPTPTPDSDPAAEEQPRGEDGRFIPKARFDEQLGKERSVREAAEARATELERQLKVFQQQQDTGKMDERIGELEDKLETARMDGNKDEALKLSKELRLLERQLRVTESSQMSERAKMEAYESMRVDIMVERLESQYEELNPSSKDYDDFLVERTLSRQTKLISTGIPPADALKQAADETMEWYKNKFSNGKKDTGLAAAAAPNTRKEEQVRKNLETQQAQPPSMSDAGKDSDKAGMKNEIDVTKLSQEEFMALPESTKAKLRGDLV
jgi:hypothetical protein